MGSLWPSSRATKADDSVGVGSSEQGPKTTSLASYIPALASTNKIAFNCAEHDDLIESVTVFRSNRAEVKRRVNLDLIRGQNHIRIERLSSSVSEDSIRVDGTGTAVILDVVYHSPFHDRSVRPSATTGLRCAIETLQNERAIVQEQGELLANYGRTLDNRSVSVEDAHRFLDMFGARQIAVLKRIQELNFQIDNAQEELSEAEQKEYEDFGIGERLAAITVVVLAEMDSPAQLMLTYMVSDASWCPFYDMRTSIAKTPPTAALHYRASITQTTGENWPDIALSLSTASPQLDSTVPQLFTWRIGFPAAVSYQPTSRSVILGPEIPSHGGTANSETETGMYIPSRHRMGVRRAHVENVGILNAKFGISGRSNIPSDRGSHKVLIAVLDLQAELEWICIPGEKESVFLNCKMFNSSGFALLPGEVSVFVDNNFRSKNRIKYISPNESLKVSLGVDSALQVTYTRAKVLNHTPTQSGLLFMAKEQQSISFHSQRIAIRNSRQTSVSVRVLDHVPVSMDSRLGVNVVSPRLHAVPTLSDNDMGDGSKELWRDVQHGMKARWAALEDFGEGAVEWSCNIAPSGEVEVELAWEVTAPAGGKWQNLIL
ncbi:hypothetical protein RHS04_06422 [Rhizoctonia solani]|uniref:Protein F37C4,5 [Caenorhabditis elegans] n=1 Tax=Rhizoctonia solani TaxID=456999 RepID=A0A8H7H6Z7_9AGAM|nr:hypothetical protein RHS04_06422 [Rhizoctonia solani]KAF8751727.1 hypothetical protein RHS01_08407 [Rhizoctonia solani]